ncbi:MAG: hypothetical protein ACXVBC_01640 [Bdellovibrionota bacterium]
MLRRLTDRAFKGSQNLDWQRYSKALWDVIEDAQRRRPDALLFEEARVLEMSSWERAAERRRIRYTDSTDPINYVEHLSKQQKTKIHQQAKRRAQELSYDGFGLTSVEDFEKKFPIDFDLDKKMARLYSDLYDETLFVDYDYSKLGSLAKAQIELNQQLEDLRARDQARRKMLAQAIADGKGKGLLPDNSISDAEALAKEESPAPVDGGGAVQQAK